MITSLAFTSMEVAKPSPLDIGKVFEIGYRNDRGAVGRFRWPYAKWTGQKFTGIGETPQDPGVNDGIEHASLNYPDNFWRPAE